MSLVPVGRRTPWLLVAAALVGLAAPGATAAGAVLDGRSAPEVTFRAGLNGIGAGTSLSSFQGQVVWVKFVLRDCPRCQRELPRAQELHERWGRSGLVVIVVVHELGPPEIGPFLDKHGYTFRVGSDPGGEIARAYGVVHRPTDYVIGIDGRVKASNGAPDEVLRTEMGHWRLARLGPVPPALEATRVAVWNWDYGAALRLAEPWAASPDAPADVRALASRLQALAREEMAARLALAEAVASRGDRAQARALGERVAAHFQGTTLEADARAALAALFPADAAADAPR